jgi:hypothetical protein
MTEYADRDPGRRAYDEAGRALLAEEVDPLTMAETAARWVNTYAGLQGHPDEDIRLQARIFQAGTSGHQTAELAGQMALVSIARDLRKMLPALLRVAKAMAEVEDLPDLGEYEDPQ